MSQIDCYVSQIIYTNNTNEKDTNDFTFGCIDEQSLMLKQLFTQTPKERNIICGIHTNENDAINSILNEIVKQLGETSIKLICYDLNYKWYLLQQEYNKINNKININTNKNWNDINDNSDDEMDTPLSEELLLFEKGKYKVPKNESVLNIRKELIINIPKSNSIFAEELLDYIRHEINTDMSVLGRFCHDLLNYKPCNMFDFQIKRLPLFIPNELLEKKTQEIDTNTKKHVEEQNNVNELLTKRENTDDADTKEEEITNVNECIENNDKKDKMNINNTVKEIVDNITSNMNTKSNDTTNANNTSNASNANKIKENEWIYKKQKSRKNKSKR